MSLKAFHIVFIIISTVLAVGFGIWSIRRYMIEHETGSLLIGIASFLGAGGLVVYGRWFLRKLGGVSYL